MSEEIEEILRRIEEKLDILIQYIVYNEKNVVISDATGTDDSVIFHLGDKNV